jgi:Cu+-exporting ATPase
MTAEWPGTRRKRSSDVADKVKDPVCGMEIDPEEAVAQEEHDGTTFYFCSESCHEKFLADPHRYGHPSD